jgi:hypothetical protein
VIRKSNSVLRISTISAIDSDVRSTVRVGRIADVTSAESRCNNVMHLLATRWFYSERIYCGAQVSPIAGRIAGGWYGRAEIAFQLVSGDGSQLWQPHFFRLRARLELRRDRKPSETQRMTEYIILAIAITFAFLVARVAARWDMRAWVGQHRAKRELRHIARRERTARWR